MKCKKPEELSKSVIQFTFVDINVLQDTIVK